MQVGSSFLGVKWEMFFPLDEGGQGCASQGFAILKYIIYFKILLV